jgi:hypothetical protein
MSRRAFKDDIELLPPSKLRDLKDAVLGIQLSTYRYRVAGPTGQRRLGFIIDDEKSPYPVNADGNTVDLYGYASMAIAAIQVQEKELTALRAEVAALKKSCRH